MSIFGSRERGSFEAIHSALVKDFESAWRMALGGGAVPNVDGFWRDRQHSAANLSSDEHSQILGSLRGIDQQYRRQLNELEPKGEKTVQWGSAAAPEKTTVDPPRDRDPTTLHETIESGASVSDTGSDVSFEVTMDPQSSENTPQPDATVELSGDGRQTTQASSFSWDPSASDAYIENEGDDTSPSVKGYDILGELGRGGMGVVYHARHRGLKREVALKMIIAGVHAAPEQLQRFRAEAEAVAQLQHPNIVQIYDVGQQNGLPFFSIEFVDGPSLEKALGGKPQMAEDAAYMIETLARAMHYAHENGIVHRDLKPANVLMTSEGAPKITDFGLVKRMEEGDSQMTREGTIMGTPSYMAPEQALGEKDVGALADVYALGSILYCMLTGHPPFMAASPWDTIKQVIGDDPVPPSQLLPSIPRDVETICLKCLHKEREKRYENAFELAEDLRRFQAGEPILARPVSKSERAWRWCRRNPVVATLSVAVLLLLLAIAIGASIAALRFNEQRQIAVEARREAERNAIAADAARQVAEENRAIAEKNEQTAKRAQELAEENEKTARIAQASASNQRSLALQSLEILVKEVQNELKDTAEHQLKQKLLETALAGLRKVAASTDTSSKRDLSMAAAHQRMGRIFELLGKPGDARAQYEQLHRIAQNLADADPQSQRHQRILSISFQMLGNVSILMGETDAARKYYHEAMKLHAELVDLNPESTNARVALVSSYDRLAAACRDLQEHDEAEKYFLQALAMRKSLASESMEKNHDARLRDVWVSSFKLGNFYLTNRNRPQQAMDYFQQAFDVASDLIQRRAGNFRARFDLAWSLIHLGKAHIALGDSDPAQKRFLKALSILAKLSKDDSQHLPAQTEYALTLARIGRHEPAAQQAEVVRSLAPTNFANLYNVACVFSLCAAAAKNGSKDTQPLQARYADSAIAVLEKAIEYGLNNTTSLETDKDFDAVRTLPAFQEILKKLQRPRESAQ